MGSIIEGTVYTYDAANRMTTSELLGNPSVNLTYNAAGRLTNDGTNTYTWDRADRLWSLGAHSYRYNGLGHRLSQQDGSNPAMSYTLDQLAPHVKVINASDGVTTHRYAHTPLDTYQYLATDGAWRYLLPDGLGSVRGAVDTTGAFAGSKHYTPYGKPLSSTGTPQSVFGFTGEQTDPTGLLFLRARYYNPALGAFPSFGPGGGWQSLCVGRRECGE